uniref:TLC domain-containing protein n=1 Tax=Calcidiscus leptoporus TaxID=127549 RepID=A0A7S0NZF3_9EUKA
MVAEVMLSDDPYIVFYRTCACVLGWCLVRLFLSHAFFGGSVVHGTKCTAAIQAALQACAVCWVVTHDPHIAPLYWAMLGFQLGDADLVNIPSPAIAFLSTLAAGEFGMQLLHMRAWFEKPSDVVMVAHHLLCLVLWPMNVANGRGLFFIAVFLTYEVSTPFLMALFFDAVKNSNLPRVIIGTVFTLTFVLVRLGTLPSTAVAAYKAIATDFPSSRLPWWYVGQYATIMFYVERVTGCLPLLLNAYWGQLVVRAYFGEVVKALSADPNAATKMAKAA